MLQSARRFCGEAIIASAFNYGLIKCVNKYLRNFAVPWPLTVCTKRPSNVCVFSKAQLNTVKVHGLSFNQFYTPAYTAVASIPIANKFLLLNKSVNPFHITKNSISNIRFFAHALKILTGNKSMNCIKFSADNHSALNIVHW